MIIENVAYQAEILRDAGRLHEARELLESQVSSGETTSQLLCLLGEVCGRAGDHTTAVRHLEAADALTPGVLETSFILAFEYFQTGQHAKALSLFGMLATQYPHIATIHDQHGLVLRELRCFEEAEREFRLAITLDAASVWPLINLANLMIKTGRYDEAEVFLNKAMLLEPDHAALYNDLGYLYLKQGKSSDATDLLRRALERNPDNPSAASNVLYTLCYRDDLSPDTIAREHRELAAQYYPAPGTTGTSPDRGERNSQRKIRIGYLSGDFREHSVAYFIEPVLQQHDQHAFSVFCYANVAVPDATTVRLQALPVSWRSIYGLSAAAAADMIRSDQIDILIDLSGHSAFNRLDVCAVKPAPVAVSWLGYPHSTGMRQFDYYLTDAWCDPPGMTEHLYSEQLWRLPKLFCCYLPPLEFPVVTPAPETSTGVITFCCFNNLAKAGDDTLAMWATILKRTPGSRLLLKSASFGGTSARNRLLKRFVQSGISEERISTLPHSPGVQEHLSHYASADIALDTYPYNGTTTTCEALWMGVPVVTLAGASHLSRVSGSLLESVGLTDMIAHSCEEYIARAVSLAGNSQYRNDLRSSLRLYMARSPLMDYTGLTRRLENACRTILAGDCP